MKIEYTKETPRKIRDYDQDEPILSSEEVEDIAEIFKTPLTGTYNWDYSVQDNRIAKLYELGKNLTGMFLWILIGKGLSSSQMKYPQCFGMNILLTKSSLKKKKENF